MVPILEKENKHGLKAARGDSSDAQKEFFVAFSPEREDPGNTTVARRDIPKVVGRSKSAGGGAGRQLFTGPSSIAPFRFPRRPRPK